MNILFGLTVFVNIGLNISFFFVLRECHETNVCIDRSLTNENHFDTKLNSLYFLLPFLTAGLYFVFFVVYFPLLVKICLCFEEAFPEIYEKDNFKCRLVSMFVFNQLFILVRFVLYCYVVLFPASTDESRTISEVMKLCVYLSEIFLATTMMIMTYKNLQSDEEAENPENKSTVVLSNHNSLLNSYNL